MKPYYTDSHVTIYHGDCLDVLPVVPPSELLATDPPYVGLVGGYSYNAENGGVSARINRSLAISDPWSASFDWVPLAMSRATLGAIVFCTHHSLPETALAFQPWRRAALVTWHKRNVPVPGKNVPRFTEEYAWCFARVPGLKWDAFKTTLIDLPKLATGAMASAERVLLADDRAAHPTQKPEELMRRLLVIGGRTVLDPFMGTGTTLVAAKRMGRTAIGIEREERYCEIAARRLSQGALDLSWQEPESNTGGEVQGAMWE